MSRNFFKYSAVIASFLMTAVFAGCGTSNKEGNLTVGNVAKVDEALCAQCHSTAVESLTGDPIYATYQNPTNKHFLNSVGCQGCHGGGAQHNGVGPLPYPDPTQGRCAATECHGSNLGISKYSTSRHAETASFDERGEAKCNRCHSHEGAVLAGLSGFTGDDETLTANVATMPGTIDNAKTHGIKCNTCHTTHNPQVVRTVTGWVPSTTKGVATPSTNKEYQLCTSCHLYLNAAGELVATGTNGTKTFPIHNNRWYRIIASTHYDDPATTTKIEGYVIRQNAANPCLDCHSHDFTTGTRQDETPPRPATIYTDWAKSGHAGGVLSAKYTAAAGATNKTTAQVAAVMAAGFEGEQFTHGGSPWSGSCQRCHTSTGAANFIDNPQSTAVNDFSHLAAGQQELIYCWACHTNAGKGTLRTLGNTTKTAYANYSGHKPTGWNVSIVAGEHNTFPNVAGSNLCISCHDGRYNNPGELTSSSTYPVTPHYMPAAATMYVKMGFVNLSTTTTAASTKKYRQSLKSNEDGGTVTSTHRKLGTPAMVGDHGITAADTNLLSNGPCAACHVSASHSLKIDQKAIDSVCSKCHDEEAGISILKEADFKAHFLEPQAEVFVNAIDLAAAVFNSKHTGITLTRSSAGFYVPLRDSDGQDLNDRTLAAADKTAAWAAAATGIYSDRTKLLGAISNLFMFDHDKAAYAHARTYTRRLLYDTIDYLDDGVLNLSVGATAVATTPTKYGKGSSAFTDGTLKTLATGTTESMTFLLKWSRSDGTWGTPQRP